MADVVVVGGGVFGLWAARACQRRGLSVTLVERERIGAGASGGVLGALSPHEPGAWNPKKAFQLEALLSLEAEAADLEAEAGWSAGYVRAGRLLPLHDESALERAQGRAEASITHWRGRAVQRVVEAPDARWLAPERAAHGALFCELSARIDPRAYLSALKAAFEARGGDLREGVAFERSEPGAAVLRGGERIAAGTVVVAAGVGAFEHLPAGLGRGEKGQAAVLACDAPADTPMLYDDGVYVAPHSGGRVAVGSTSERECRDAAMTDEKLDTVIAKARALCPALRAAPVLERWAGVRPRAIGRDPLVGRLPEAPHVIAATGGFKIGLALAHRIGDAVAAMIESGAAQPDLPDSFRFEAHLQKLNR